MAARPAAERKNCPDAGLYMATEGWQLQRQDVGPCTVVRTSAI